MKKYAVGNTVYIIEGNRDIRAGKIIRVSGDLYTIRFEYENATRVHGSRLFASMEEAAEQLPVHLRPGFMEKKEKRVWIDSQTEEEIMRGIREAKDLSAYDNLSASAYLRAKEDYLMGINFSRVLTLRYGNSVSNYLNTKYQAISVGRVMTCVLGMVVRREREIRAFVKTPFYRVLSSIALEGENFEGEWRAVEGSRYFQTPYLYKENGFKEKAYAEKLIQELLVSQPLQCTVEKIERKKENRNPPLLFNLAELQNVCSKLFKISPDETLKIVQELYEKKLVTYPRTDARVLSTAAAKEIYKNISGLRNYEHTAEIAQHIIEQGNYKKSGKDQICQ